MSSLAENLSDWVLALNAFEREYGIANPVPEQRKQWESEKNRGKIFTIHEYFRHFGEPWDSYPQDKRAEVLAFAVGYFGQTLKGLPLRHRVLLKGYPDQLDTIAMAYLLRKTEEDPKERINMFKIIGPLFGPADLTKSYENLLKKLATQHNIHYHKPKPRMIQKAYQKGVQALARDREAGILKTTVQERLEARLDWKYGRA